MLAAGSGAALDRDGARAGTFAARRAMQAAQIARADLAIVVAGAAHAEDGYVGVLESVRTVTGAAQVIGASTTGVLTGQEEIESPSAVGVLVLAAEGGLGAPVWVDDLKRDAQAGGRLLGTRLGQALGVGSPGAGAVVFVDPTDLDAAAFLGGLSAGAPGLVIGGAGASGGETGVRVFCGGEAREGAAVGWPLPAALAPAVAVTHACQPLSEPMVVTASEGNVILSLEGRPPLEVLKAILSEPRNRGLEKAASQILVGIGDVDASGRAAYVVRPAAGLADHAGAMAVAEPVRPGQLVRFTLRDAIGAREDMKDMLGELETRRAGRRPSFGLYFNCAGRGSALYGSAGLDPELIRRRFGPVPLLGLESAFELGPASGRTRVHMFTGVLLLAG